MLTVTNISPAQNATGVFINTPIVAEFSDRILQSSANRNTIQLHRMDYDMPVERIEGSITFTSDNVITFQPYSELTRNSNYQFILIGDFNVGDTVINGVSSTQDGFNPYEPMDGNYVLNFTTGEERDNGTGVNVETVDVSVYTDLDRLSVATPIDTTLPGTPVLGSYIGSGDFGSTSTSSYLQLVRTTPANESVNISDISEIVFVFDEAIDSSTTIISGALTIERHYIGIDCDWDNTQEENNRLSTQAITGHVENNMVIFDLSNVYSGLYPDLANQSGFPTVSNSEYTVTLMGGYIRGFSGRYNERTTINFMSSLEPIYTNISTMRRQLPDNIAATDYELYWWIGLASRYLTLRYNGERIPPELCYQAMWFIICYLMYTLLNRNEYGLEGLKARRQFGLEIEYYAPDRKKNTDPYEDCWENALRALDAGMGHGMEICVKSGSTTRYPGRRKGVEDFVRGKRYDTLP